MASGRRAPWLGTGSSRLDQEARGVDMMAGHRVGLAPGLVLELELLESAEKKMLALGFQSISFVSLGTRFKKQVISIPPRAASIDSMLREASDILSESRLKTMTRWKAFLQGEQQPFDCPPLARCQQNATTARPQRQIKVRCANANGFEFDVGEQRQRQSGCQGLRG